MEAFSRLFSIPAQLFNAKRFMPKIAILSLNLGLVLDSAQQSQSFFTTNGRGMKENEAKTKDLAAIQGGQSSPESVSRPGWQRWPTPKIRLSSFLRLMFSAIRDSWKIGRAKIGGERGRRRAEDGWKKKSNWFLKKLPSFYRGANPKNFHLSLMWCV